MAGDSAMAEHTPGGADVRDRFVRIDDGGMHVAEDGKPGAPALLLIQNAAAPLACWDPFVPQLAGAHRVIRVDLLGRGSPASPADRYDIRAQAGRVCAVLDSLGVSQVTVVGHSSGCTVATALAEQRPGAVAGLALIDFGPSLEAKIPERPLFRLVLTQFPGRLVIFGTDDQRWRSSLASSYQAVPGARVELLPGVGHSPMLEDPQTTGKLLLDFASAVGHPS
jgi:pimeloyl-ACP methyl ester carboxylesterase